MAGNAKKARAAMAEQRTGIRMDKKRLAAVTGFSVSWIEKLIKEGAPVYTNGKSGVPLKIDSAQFIRWLVEREREKAEAKYAAIIRRLRMETAEQAGDSSEPGAGNDISDLMTDEEAKKRLNLARAKMAEIDLQKRRGEVVEIRTVTNVLDRIVGACRARLLAIPKKISPTIITVNDVNNASVIIEDAIHEGLHELSRLDSADFIE
jgi:phage terminase Nu1 subunit (DNA packaging protein)